MPFKDIKIPYVDELLSYLKSKGYKMAVCSSSTMSYITRALQEGNIEDYFDYVITGYDLPVGKPDPAIYLKAMKELDVTPDEAVIIEDAYYGIESGKRAGCFVIARHDPKYSYDQSRADMLVDDYRDLIRAEDPDAKLKARFVMTVDPSKNYDATVVEEHDRAENRGTEETTVMIRALIDDPESLPDGTRAGAGVSAKVYCGKRPLGFVCFNELVAFLQKTVFFWFE